MNKIFKNGDKVSVEHVNEVGVIAGRCDNNCYIVHWDKPPFDTLTGAVSDWNAMLVNANCITQTDDS